ncbi:uncharacterized protein LOC131257630 [Magnolia sinica]|uniref:uncharacterized protein LOC131257630 n=1 Tax=Magnolia sinica TaxID=86752 RepID=UPI0026583F22|nr:uncharacterized protein LOC131257630 [Magnolia sinica]
MALPVWPYIAEQVMSTMREPFAPLLSKLSVVAEGKASAPNEDIKRCIKDCTKDCINEAKTALQFTKKWEESLIGSFDELTRTVDELLGDDKIITKPPSDFLSSKNGEMLIAITMRVRAMASKVSHDSSATTSSPSSPSKDKLKESAAHEEELQRKADKITAPDLGRPLLQGSYDDLEPQLKECLLCFSAFPENIVIKRRIMIYWWIGEGLVTPMTDGRTAEEVGEDCFKMLISSGLIEPIYQKHSKIAKYCKIHPWARQMLVSKAKESKFFKFDPQDRPTFNTNQSQGI